MAALDRALTVGGIGRALTGELSEVSRGIYATQYGKAKDWKRAVLHSSTGTFTPEQVAQYALWLVEQGYARSTAGLAVRAIRWWHRVAGEPVPDGLPASYVLRGGDSTPGDHDAVNDTENAARRDPYELLAAFVSACKPGETKGQRDLALIHAAYSGGLSHVQISNLDIERVVIGPSEGRPGRLRYWLPYTIDTGVWLDHLTEQRHYATLCPACTTGRWLRALREAGNRSGPVFRSVDKGGNIAGGMDRKGGTSAAQGRLAARSISPIVLRAVAFDAGLGEMIPNPLGALRLAGALAAYVNGDIDAATAATRAGHTPGSRLMLTHLIRATDNHRED